MEQEFDIIIVGAGAAGLMAALEMAIAGKTVLAVEARNRIGGRIELTQPPGFDHPAECGAEFIHGDLELTIDLLKKAGIPYYPLKGEMWQHRNGKWQQQEDFIEDFSLLKKKFGELENDIPVAEFLSDYLKEEKYNDLRFTLQNYAEGYAAADTSRASTFALREDLSSSSEEQYRIEGGYGALLNYLFVRCREKGVQFSFGEQVKEIYWQKDKVDVITEQSKHTAGKALITVPLGVLQTEMIRFDPAIPEYMAAAKQLGFGAVIKFIFSFDRRFWKEEEFAGGKDLSQLQFLFSDAAIPTWWTAYPNETQMLTGWLGGPQAAALASVSDEELVQMALQSLGNIFDVAPQQLSKWIKGKTVANWQKDPFSCGAYSYEVVNGNRAREILLNPVKQAIYFAGEALHRGVETGTVEAALQCGKKQAKIILDNW